MMTNSTDWIDSCVIEEAIGTFFYTEIGENGFDRYVFFVEGFRFEGKVNRKISMASLGSKYKVSYCKTNPEINQIKLWDRIIESEYKGETIGEISNIKIDFYSGNKVILVDYIYSPSVKLSERYKNKYARGRYTVRYSDALHKELFGDIKIANKNGVKKINKQYKTIYSVEAPWLSYLIIE